MNRLTLIAVAGIISLGLGVKLASSKAPQAAEPAQMTLTSTALPPTKSQPSPMSKNSVSKLPSITISSCNGELGDANFRSAPSMAKSAIEGVIESGQSVYLTGRTVQADGETWHEAISPDVIPNSGKQIQLNQTGWIAVCFVK